jgi:hypothetical protein
MNLCVRHIGLHFGIVWSRGYSRMQQGLWIVRIGGLVGGLLCPVLFYFMLLEFCFESVKLNELTSRALRWYSDSFR